MFIQRNELMDGKKYTFCNDTNTFRFFYTYAIKESKESPAQFVSSVYILYNN